MTLSAGGASWQGAAASHLHTPLILESAPRLDGLESILDEFGERWHRGEMPRVEDFVSRLGRCDPADVVELIYHEFCLAESSDDPPDAAEYLDRFPQYRDRLARLFGLREALGSSRLDALVEPAGWPEPGEAIGPYTLVRSLGQGSFARVFLAEQVDLERRLVVVKVANRPSPEPRLLARAQHAHIVDVLRHGETPDGQLHLICMPFLGGATLADVLTARASRGRRARDGRDLLRDLDQAAAPEYPQSSLERPAREILASLSYPKALAWTIARLAEALDHAHSRGVSHGDLKPSNVLLASDGRPMLFDFNLAVDWGEADIRDDGGGTLAYMAPERLAAIAEPRGGKSPRPSDRHRADVYALGLVLLEALTGDKPEVPDLPGLLSRELASVMAKQRSAPGFLARQLAGRIPRELRVILEHCLAVDPWARYARASDLAEDLDRYRSDLPPIHVEEHSRVPRLARWMRRQRLAIAAGGLVLAAGTFAAVLASMSYRSTLHDQAAAKLEAIWNGHEPGVYRFRRYGQTFGDDPGDPVEVAERHLDRYGVLEETDWRTRDDVRYLDPADRADLEVWMAEQAWRLAHALGERHDSPDDWRRGLHTLERAMSWAPFGALRREAAQLSVKLDRPIPRLATHSSSSDWQSKYLDGLALESADPARALICYQQAVKGCPDSFWANYRSAVTQAQTGHWPDSITSLSRCIARRPRNPALRVQRAGLLLNTDPDAALKDCELALDLDPDLAWAYNTRAIIQRARGITNQPEADFQHFWRLLPNEESYSPRMPHGFGLGFGNEAGILELTPSAGRRSSSRPDRESANILFDAAIHWYRSGDRFSALEAFDQLLAAQPDSIHARYNRMLVLRQLKLPDGRKELLSLLEDPQFGEFVEDDRDAFLAYHHAATDAFARTDLDSAIDLASAGLALAKKRKRFELESQYLLSRIYAHGAATKPGFAAKSLKHLKAAIHENPRSVKQWIARDGVFDDLRPEIEMLIFKNEL
jgi:serine/threonine protein kinase